MFKNARHLCFSLILLQVFFLNFGAFAAPKQREASVKKQREIPYIQRNRHPPPGKLAVTALGGFTYLFGLALGGRVSYRILPGGFVRRINNSIELVGSFFYVGNDQVYNLSSGTYVQAGGRWSFHLIPRFSVYGQADIGLFKAKYYHSATGLTATVTAGCQWRFAPGLDLVGELGERWVLAGLGIRFM